MSKLQQLHRQQALVEQQRQKLFALRQRHVAAQYQLVLKQEAEEVQLRDRTLQKAFAGSVLESGGASDTLSAAELRLSLEEQRGDLALTQEQAAAQGAQMHARHVGERRQLVEQQKQERVALQNATANK